jgi:antirestriction protein ArdC
MATSQNTTDWTALLQKAVSTPGFIHSAYSAFHGYSIGNQLLALWQCDVRGITPGPIATFKAWQDKGRYVRKGEKAIELCMPITCKGTRKDDSGEDVEFSFSKFTFRRNWFVLSQTDGADVDAVAPNADWDESKALAALEVSRIPFELLNGNVQGYAKGRQVAVSPVAAIPHKTLFHELAHIVLGHCQESEMTDSDITPRSIREVEAESVAMICCESLGMTGAEYSRGYIQNWLSGDTIPERSAQKIFSAADKILKAGKGVA